MFKWFRTIFTLGALACKSNWTVHGTCAFPVFITPIVWNMCENLHYESVYFKELHNEQEYYWPTIYRAGAAVVSTITNYIWVVNSTFGCLIELPRWSVARAFPSKYLSKLRVLGHRQKENASDVKKLGREVVW